MRPGKYTSQDKRKLTYDKSPSHEEPSGQLQLSQEFKSKITSVEHKRIKEAFYLECTPDLKLTRKNFPVVIRSLGVIQKTVRLFEIFDQIENAEMTWRQFIQAYLALRSKKGSYGELSKAMNALDGEYRGNWEQFFSDLGEMGDILTSQELDIFQHEIMKDTKMTNEGLTNCLMGFK